jgi:hypothetical protein
MATYARMLASTKALCAAFAAKAGAEDLLEYFSTTYQISAFEHGLPSLAPFLGRPFNGVNGVEKYFTLISDLLEFEEMEFDNYFVDEEKQRACVQGEAKFTWKETGESWDERFVYVLDFDDQAKVVDYRVWADTGAAYLAKAAQLKQVNESAATKA